MQTNLPPLPFWQARSWWLTLIAVITPVLALLDLDWPWVTDPDTPDAIMHVVGGVAAALAWRERVNPRRRLVVMG